jgi:EAL domain-containing protein (putative c-di-GMP-specific phosphodiesterase class I)
VYPDHGVDVDTLIRHADVAMYTAKQGQEGVHVYHDETDRHGVSRLNLVAELPRAMDLEELSVHYQPQIDLRSGRVVGVEALLRWQHPRHGWVAPGRFMPLAEHTDLMGPLTEYVLRKALAQSAAWTRLGLDLTMAVNGSARNFHDVRFPGTVAALLEELGVDPGRLELEITENAVMADPARTATVLAELRDMGVSVSMDDFGTGYSSLANLRSLPLDRVKIDRAFVLDMLVRDDDALIVRSIIELAGNLGLQTVAEGVEAADVLQALGAFGCDTAQGFHVARPASAERTTAWLLEASAGYDVA